MIKDKTLKNKLENIMDASNIFCCGRCIAKDKCNLHKSGNIEKLGLKNLLKKLIKERPNSSYTNQSATIYFSYAHYMESCVFMRFRCTMLQDVLEIPEVRVD